MNFEASLQLFRTHTVKLKPPCLNHALDTNIEEATMTIDRTPSKKKAKELAKYFRAERPDYPYMKSVFRALREELEVQVPKTPVRLPEVPTEEEMRLFYQAVWNCRNFTDMILIKTLFIPGFG